MRTLTFPPPHMREIRTLKNLADLYQTEYVTRRLLGCTAEYVQTFEGHRIAIGEALRTCFNLHTEQEQNGVPMETELPEAVKTQVQSMQEWLATQHETFAE